MKSIFTGSIHNENSRKQADLILVVLASQSVRAVIETGPDGLCNILVPDDDVFKAQQQLKKYARENKEIPRQPPDVPTRIFFSPAALITAFFLSAIHYIITTRGLHSGYGGGGTPWGPAHDHWRKIRSIRMSKTQRSGPLCRGSHTYRHVQPW
ncbi:hypothetical protein [Desulfobacter postgatei]|uniref:Uncharacterized protein n=1 Tax=Desulfobacter postgatei 2ac9 TaxID=879212 RepID=I5B7N3_9BACT|nr:hypothetical protein DespoDRAFT_03761 [Desulfobacter postgatei 2ac9]